MMKRETISIANVYVPIKRRALLMPAGSVAFSGLYVGDVTARGIGTFRRQLRGLAGALAQPPSPPCRQSLCSHVRRLRQPARSGPQTVLPTA